MPIEFQQPGPYSSAISSAYGAAQAMKDFAPFLYRAYGGGGGGGGGPSGGGGGGMRMLPGDVGGGGGTSGGGGGGGTDPLALYQGKQEIDRYFAKQDQDAAIAAIQGNTADEAPDEGQIADLKDRQYQSDFNQALRNEGLDPETGATADEWPQTQDEAGTGVVPGAGPGAEATGGAVTGNAGNRLGLDPGQVPPGMPGQNIPQAQQPPPQPPPQTAPPEFTQADQLQLQRLQASKAQVQAQLASGMIDPRSAQRMIRQLQIPMSVLQQQQQAARTQAQQLQLQQAQQAHAHQTAMDLTSTRMRASAGADGIRRDLPDGRGGVLPPSQWNDRLQKWEPMPHVQEAANRQQETVNQQRTRDRTEEADFMKHLNEVRKLVNGSGTTPGIELQTRDLPDPDNPGQTVNRRETKEEAVDRIMEGDLGHSSLDSLRESRNARRENPPLTTPNARPTAQQAERLSGFEADYRRIRQAGGTDEVTQEYVGKLRRAEQMYRRAGSVSGMSTATRREYQDIRDKVSRWLRTPWWQEQQQQEASAAPSPGLPVLPSAYQAGGSFAQK